MTRPRIVVTTEETAQDKLDKLDAEALRIRSHTMLDELLTEHPETSVVMIAIDGKVLEAASLPAALSVKRGMIDSLYEMIHVDEDA
jgi:hypothetical protein